MRIPLTHLTKSMCHNPSFQMTTKPKRQLDIYVRVYDQHW